MANDRAVPFSYSAAICHRGPMRFALPRRLIASLDRFSIFNRFEFFL